MKFENLSKREQDILLQCLVLILNDGGLEGEFHTRLAADEEEVAKLISAWPDFANILPEDIFIALIRNTMNEIYSALLYWPQKWPKEFDFTIEDAKNLSDKLRLIEPTKKKFEGRIIRPYIIY